MVRECIALGALARKSAHRRRPGDRLLRREFVFRGAGLELFECERQLIDQPRRAFRSLPIDLTLQPGDPQFLLGNQRAVFGRFRAGDREFRGDLQPFARSTANASFRAAMSSGTASGDSIHNNE